MKDDQFSKKEVIGVMPNTKIDWLGNTQVDAANNDSTTHHKNKSLSQLLIAITIFRTIVAPVHKLESFSNALQFVVHCFSP